MERDAIIITMKDATMITDTITTKAVITNTDQFMKRLFKNPKLYAYSLLFLLTTSILGAVYCKDVNGLLGYANFPYSIVGLGLKLPFVALIFGVLMLILPSLIMGIVCITQRDKKSLYMIMTALLVSVVTATLISSQMTMDLINNLNKS